MTPTDRNPSAARRGDGHPLHQLARAAGRAASTVAGIIAECNYAQRRMLQLRLSPDRYVLGSAQAPDTYAEFLFRTSGWLQHEPPADKRLADRRARN